MAGESAEEVVAAIKALLDDRVPIEGAEQVSVEQRVLAVVCSAEHWADLAGSRLQEIRRQSGEPDPHWHGYVTDQAGLIALVEQWRVGEAVPEPVREVLRVTRRLVIDSYSTYEYAMLAVTWGLMLIEASLRGCLPVSGPGHDSRTFRQLISTAQKQGLFAGDEADALRGAAQLRNRVVHGHLHPKPPPDSYTPGDTLALVSAIHGAISDIYNRAGGSVMS